MRILLFVCLYLVCIANIFAQDKHFTQFYASPISLNPALTGLMDGKMRANVIYRDQWRGVLDRPYTTTGGSVDFKFNELSRSIRNDAIGLGLQFFNDRVGDVDFTTNQIALSTAYHKSLDASTNSFLSLGVQLSLEQRLVNYGKLTFQDQFNGSNGYTGSTGEQLPNDNIAFSDFSVGLNYNTSPYKNALFFVGGAMHHVLRPAVAFYPVEKGGNSRLFSRFSVQTGAQIPMGSMSFSPRLLASLQGPHIEINTGANLRFSLTETGRTAMHVGFWGRPVRYEAKNWGFDAVVPMLGLELDSVLFGFSYDVNLKDVTIYRKGQGAFELSVTYFGDYENETILCPKF
jgi:type IX secretion system PorP/SprF family membrane protein